MAPRKSKRGKAESIVEEEGEKNEVQENGDMNETNGTIDGQAEEPEPSTSKVYFDYNPAVFSSMVRYRSHSDIVAQTIIKSQANGVDRYEIGNQLSINSKTKSGNRRVSSIIQQLCKSYPDQIAMFQKMEGKIRFLKYFYKGGESTPSSFSELMDQLEKLLGAKFPYSCEDIVNFPEQNLSSLRISDITLRRFLFILEFLKQEDVIVLTWRLSKHLSQKETELGYQFAIDKKSVMKCLYALEQKQLLRVLKLENTYSEKPEKKSALPVPETEENSATSTIQIVVPYEIDSTDDPRIGASVERVIGELQREGRIFPTGQIASTKPPPTPKPATRSKKKKDKAGQENQEIAEDEKPPILATKSRKRKIADTTNEVEKDWNSYISSFLPTDKDIIKKKKSELPILTQKTLDSLSGNFRRHHNVRRTLTTTQAPRKTTLKSRNTDASISSLLESITKTEIPEAKEEENESKSPKKGIKRRVKKKPTKLKDQNEDVEMSEASTSNEQKSRTAKRKPDQIDLESLKQNMYIRSRFSQQEYDMLVLIRSISYFLNPIHRFWLNPSVMRDIMHEYVPESRCKTVSSLLAASAREMLRPGRNAQLQYIVKTLCSNKEMTSIRDKLAGQDHKTEAEKNDVFWQAFKTAHKIIFDEPDQVPDTSVDDEEFLKFLGKKKFILSVVDSTSSSSFPKRSRKPETVNDIQHCVAFNLIMSTLIAEACRPNKSEEDPELAEAPRVDLLLNSISSTSLAETLEIIRGDGLVSKVRNPQSNPNLMRNQATISIYYRHFFNHFYRKDLIDLLKDINVTSRADGTNPTDEDNPAVLLRMFDYIYDKNEHMEINLSHVSDMIDCSLMNVKGEEDDLREARAVKNVRQLESAPLRLEKISIGLAPMQKSFIDGVPSREGVLSIIGPIYTCNSLEDQTELEKALKSKIDEKLNGKIRISEAISLLKMIKERGFYGMPVEELKGKSKLSPEIFDQLLEIFIQIGAAFPCGIDVRRFVSVEFSSPWFIKTDSFRFSSRPWTCPNGTVNWPILRWMSESLLMNIHSKAGITMNELYMLYSFVLNPVLVDDLIDFLGAIGCCKVETGHFSAKVISSPFSSDPNSMKPGKYVLPKIESFNKFAIFFVNTNLPKQLLHNELKQQ